MNSSDFSSIIALRQNGDNSRSCKGPFTRAILAAILLAIFLQKNGLLNQVVMKYHNLEQL